MLKVKQDIKTM